MPLQTIYRPDNTKDIVGNRLAMGSLNQVLSRENDKPHAYLFTGPAGTGKTTLARIVANKLGSSVNTYTELNGADYRGIDMVREMRSVASLEPMNGKARVWLIDEAHQLTREAQEGLLKLVEDSPAKAYFIFSTTEPEKLQTTLKRRCHHTAMKLLDKNVVVDYLKEVVEKEFGDDATIFSKKVYEAVYEESGGSIGMALKILDSIIDADNVDEDGLLEIVRQESAGKEEAIELTRFLMKKAGSQSEKDWKEVARLLKGLSKQSENAEGIRKLMMSYCSSVLLNNEDPRAGLIILSLKDTSFYYSGMPALVGACYEIIMGD